MRAAVRRDRADVVARLRDPDLRGLPPNLPLARDDAALRLERTDPRHAGQNETKSILWVGHFAIGDLLTWKEFINSHSNVLGSLLQRAAI